jgi:hypothetical protein
MSNANAHSHVFDGSTDLPILAEQVAAEVFRRDFTAPGFALVDAGVDRTPHRFREVLIALTDALNAVYRARFGRQLVYLSLGRFDQKATTRAHRDGAPDESILILGYEPSAVASRLFLLDYTRYAVEHEMTPHEFLDRLNPAFGDNETLLRDYTEEIAAFQSSRYQILVVNNSAAPWEGRARGMLGVLHKAIVLASPAGQPRHVNSLTLTTADLNERVGRTSEEVREFLESAAVAVLEPPD